MFRRLGVGVLGMEQGWQRGGQWLGRNILKGNVSKEVRRRIACVPSCDSRKASEISSAAAALEPSPRLADAVFATCARARTRDAAMPSSLAFEEVILNKILGQ